MPPRPHLPDSAQWNVSCLPRENSQTEDNSKERLDNIDYRVLAIDNGEIAPLIESQA